VTGTMTDGKSVDLTAAARGTVYTSSDLTVVNFENANGKAASGDPGSVTITATNNGPTGATNVVVTDILPAGTTFVSSSTTQGTCSGTTTVTCALGSMPNSAIATITLTIKMPSAATTVSNTATVTASENDPSPLNNSSTANTIVTAAIVPTPALSTWMLLMLAAILSAWAVVRLRGV
jgi:uncharacterized repeat protein (TIGR01451 family)